LVKYQTGNPGPAGASQAQEEGKETENPAKSWSLKQIGGDGGEERGGGTVTNPETDREKGGEKHWVQGDGQKGQDTEGSGSHADAVGGFPGYMISQETDEDFAAGTTDAQETKNRGCFGKSEAAIHDLHCSCNCQFVFW